jgi:hypothetical protein
MLLAAVQILFSSAERPICCSTWPWAIRWAASCWSLMVYAWVAASLGLLVGRRGESRGPGGGNLGVLSTMVMAALGGCWWPLEIVPDTVQVLAYAFPDRLGHGGACTS